MVLYSKFDDGCQFSGEKTVCKLFTWLLRYQAILGVAFLDVIASEENTQKLTHPLFQQFQPFQLSQQIRPFQLIQQIQPSQPSQRFQPSYYRVIV